MDSVSGRSWFYSVFRPRLSVHVFPISSFAFRHPLNSCLQASFASVLSFGFSNPFGVFLFVALAEALQNSQGLLIFLELYHEFVLVNLWHFSLGIDPLCRISSL